MLKQAFSFDRIDRITVCLNKEYCSIAERILVHPTPDWTYPDIVVTLKMNGDDLWLRCLDWQANHKDQYPPVEIHITRHDAPEIRINDGTLTHLFQRDAEVVGKMSCREFNCLLTGEVITEEHLYSQTLKLREERIIRERVERLIKVESNRPFLTRFRDLLED